MKWAGKRTALALSLCLSFAASCALTSIPTAASAASRPTTLAPASVPAAAPTSIAQDGIFKVGKDIRAGIYFGVLRKGEAFGSYSRLKCKTDTSACRLDWGFVGLNQQMIVQIKSKDAYFSSKGMSWVPAASAKSRIGNKGRLTTSGIYRVTTDMRPGTWRATPKSGAAGSLGVYQRLKCLDSSQPACVIDSKSSSGRTSVTIKVSSSDKYFRTAGFGTWTRIGN